MSSQLVPVWICLGPKQHHLPSAERVRKSFLVSYQQEEAFFSLFLHLMGVSHMLNVSQSQQLTLSSSVSNEKLGKLS